MLWIRARIKKNTFLWNAARHCYRIGYKIHRIPELTRRSCNMDWRIKKVQLDITYRCNKLCEKCNRFCNFTELPYLKNSDMTIEQIEKFTSHVQRKNIRLSHIQILGGEPLLHPQLCDFISVIFYKLMIPGNALRLEIWTNGIIDANEALKKCQQDPQIKKAFQKKTIALVVSPKEQDKLFRHVLSAPADLGLTWDMCWFPYDCGILLNTYGYWPGPACGSTGLLFGLSEYAKHEFPISFRDTWPDIKKDLCRYCPAGSNELCQKSDGPISPSYKEAFMKWANGKISAPKRF